MVIYVSGSLDELMHRIRKWNVTDVGCWLFHNGFAPEIVHKFVDEEVNGEALLHLNDRMIKELLPKIGHQACFLAVLDREKSKLESDEDDVIQGQGASSSSNNDEPMPSIVAVPPSPVQEVSNTWQSCSVVSPVKIEFAETSQQSDNEAAWAWSEANQWPLHFSLPTFPPDIQMVLNQRREITHLEKIKMINTLYDHMSQFVEMYPTPRQYTEVAATLIQKYHSLRDQSESGYDSWKVSLRQKFKYMRRKIPFEDKNEFMRAKVQKFGTKLPKRRITPEELHNMLKTNEKSVVPYKGPDDSTMSMSKHISGNSPHSNQSGLDNRLSCNNTYVDILKICIPSDKP